MHRVNTRGGCHQLSERAFSLVETLLAIGIVSFAMVSVMGLIPLGLTTFRSAMNVSVESTIVQRLAGEVQRTDFANQISSKTFYYFDEQGIQTTVSGALFTAEIDPPHAVDAGNIVPSTIPARTVLIKVRNRAMPAMTNSYSVLIPSI